jgi:hypothetical protein
LVIEVEMKMKVKMKMEMLRKESQETEFTNLRRKPGPRVPRGPSLSSFPTKSPRAPAEAASFPRLMTSYSHYS